MSNRTWFALGISFGAGAVVGFVVGSEMLREKLSREYRESLESVSRAMKMASTVDHDEAEDLEIEPLTFTEEPQEIIITDFNGEPVKNNYHKAIEATETGFEKFVDGGVNDYGISYIEEEDYFDEDGRAKHQITIMMDDHSPVFLMGGTPIDDWDERVGDSILVDFYKLVPPGIQPILYVRNHRTDEDYEVIRESP